MMDTKIIQDNLGNNSLVLQCGQETVYESNKPGLRPLIMCIEATKESFKDKECILYDKVIGLAAARMIVNCGFIREVNTLTASRMSVELLKASGIPINAHTIVENILNKERTAVCPMEQKAVKMADNHEFYIELRKIFMS